MAIIRYEVKFNMRDIDQTNLEHDRVKQVEADLTRKLTAFIERINVKISSLEAKVGSLMAPQAPKNDVITRYDPFDTPCEEESPVTYYSVYSLGSQVYLDGSWKEISELTFDSQGILYTLTPIDGKSYGETYGNVIISEEDLLNKIRSRSALVTKE